MTSPLMPSRDVARSIVDPPSRVNGWETGTVTTTSPFTVQLPDGTVVAGMPRLRSCLAGMGDTVAIRKVGTDRLVIDAIDTNGPPLVKIGGRQVTQSIPTGATTTCTFAGTDVAVDSHGWANSGTNRIEPTVQGWYLFAGQASSTSNLSDGVRAAIFGRVGGSVIVSSRDVNGGSSQWGGSFAEVIYCDGSAAHYFDVGLFHVQGVAVSFTWSYSVTLVRSGLA